MNTRALVEIAEVKAEEAAEAAKLAEQPHLRPDLASRRRFRLKSQTPDLDCTIGHTIYAMLALLLRPR